MDNGFWSSLIATVLTCFLILALMSAGLVQVVLEKKRHRLLNIGIIGVLTVGLALSLFTLMQPTGQTSADIEEINQMPIPSNLFVETPAK